MLYISFKQIVCHDIAMRFFLGNLIWSKQFKNVKQLDLVFCNAMSSNLYYILELQYHLLKYNVSDVYTYNIITYMYYYNTTLQQKFDKKKKTSQSVALQIQRRIFFLQICLRMASCRLQSTNVNCHLTGLHNIYISDFS